MPTNLIEELIPAVRTIAIYLSITIAWWYLTGRKKKFLKWIGLKKMPGNYNKILLWTAVFFGISIISQLFIVPNILPEGITIAQQYAGIGLSALIPALFFGITTGFGEELFFRGLIGKRFCNRYGFKKGNIIQALFFGLWHGIGFPIMIIFFTVSEQANISYLRIFIIFISSTILGALGGWILGYVTEKTAKGSIIPAILIHGGGNFLLAMAEAFNLIN